MKKIIYKSILLAVAMYLLPMSVFAQQQLPTSGTWNGREINGEEEVNLNGDIDLEGTITIKNGGTLKIKNTAGKEVTINRKQNEPMFVLEYGGTLTIKGEDGKSIVIDGGANMQWVTTDEEWNARKKKSWEKYDGWGYSYAPLTGNDNFPASMIRTNGNLILENVRIEDFNGGNDLFNHAIHVAFVENSPCGKTDLKNCMITRCRADRGAAIFVSPQTNDANNNESCAVTLEKVTITQCMVNPQHYTNGAAWGGVIRFSGGSESNLTMTGCKMEQNYSTADGSCLWWNAGGGPTSTPHLILNGCKFINNRSDRDAGAVRLESGFNFEGENTVFENNSCGRYGGAIQVADYNQPTGDVQVMSFIYELNEKLQVKNNYAVEGGGGIAFYYIGDKLKDGFTFTIRLNGLTVTNNRAGVRGGGILFTDLRVNPSKTYNFKVYLNSGTISDNTAVKAGGGIFARKMTIENETTRGNGITISGNKVTDAGEFGEEEGAKGGGGGINLYDGKMNLNSCTITGNTVKAEGDPSLAKGYGGGIMLNRSTFTLDGSNYISSNKANVGGGVAVVNEMGEEPKIVFLSNGSIEVNEAYLCGGGVAIVGNVEMKINGINIKGNKALNAGGIFIRGRMDGESPIEGDNATMTYMGGQITGNKANLKQGESVRSNETGYKKTTENITGMGGGICVGGNSTLEVLVTDGASLGIQGNEADNGADDVFCNGLAGTKVVLPNVSTMTVENGDRLFWVEDYITNDPEYLKGTNINPKWNNDNIRYRVAKEENRMDQVFRLSQPINGSSKYSFNKQYEESKAIYEIFENDNTYMCLTLGEVNSYIILQKKGMAERDNAIFKIYRWDIEKGESYEPKEEDLYMTMILTKGDKTDDDLRSKRIDVPYGFFYGIKETPWSWAYTTDPKQIVKQIDKNTTDVSQRTFTFTNTPKDDTPKHAESVVVNKMPGNK